MNRATLAMFAAGAALVAASTVIACANDDGAAGNDFDGGVAAVPDTGPAATTDAATDAAPDANARDAGPDGSAPCSDDDWCRGAPPDAGGASWTLQSVSERAPNDVWAGGGRLIHFDGSAWATEPQPEGIQIASVLTLPTSLLVSGNDGVHRRDADGTWHLEYGGEPFQSFNARTSVLRANPSNGQAWLAVADYTPLTTLYRRSLTGAPTWTKITTPDTLGGVRDISIDASGNVWVAADFAVGLWTAATSKWIVNVFLAPYSDANPQGEKNNLAIAGGGADVWVGGALLEDTVLRPKAVATAITLAAESLNSPTALLPTIESLAKTGDNTGWAAGNFFTFGDDPIEGLINKTLPLVLRMKGGTNTIERLLPQGGFEVGAIHSIWASASEVWAVGDVGGTVNNPPSELIFRKKVAP